MAQQPENKNQAKGFSGLDSMVSDVSKDVERAERIGQSNQSRSEASAGREEDQGAAEPNTSGFTDTSSVQSPHGIVGTQGAATTSGSSITKWVLGLGALIFVVWLIANPGEEERPRYKPPPVPSPVPALIPSPVPAPPPSAPPRPSGAIGEKPPGGEGHVLDREQIRYCLSEDIRLDAINLLINSYSNVEVDRFNAMVADYNSRCVRFKYRRGTLESVRSEVESGRTILEGEGRTVVEQWRASGKATQKQLTAKTVLSPSKKNRSQKTRPDTDNSGTEQRSTSAEKGRKETSPRTLDLSGLNSAERSSIESACSYDKIINGPAAYNQCLSTQLAKLRPYR